MLKGTLQNSKSNYMMKLKRLLLFQALGLDKEEWTTQKIHTRLVIARYLASLEDLSGENIYIRHKHKK